MLLSMRAHRLCFGHSDAVPLFTDAIFHLAPGWTGLVGANGAGKTTLLRLLAGELAPSIGAILREPRQPRLAFCSQEVDELDEGVRVLARDDGGAAQQLRGLLRLAAADLVRWANLSPGERKRWQIGAALTGAPDVLMLDEPTNHLDAEGRAWLMAALSRYGGLGIVVSHDRALLDALTERTLRIDRGTIRLWPGAYTDAKATWEAEERSQLTEHTARREEQRSLAEKLSQARREHARADAARSMRHQAKGPRDHDGRSMLAKFRRASAEKRLGRSVTVLRDRLERAEERQSGWSPSKSLGRSVFVSYERAPNPVLMTLDAPEVCAGTTAILRNVRIALRREDRVRVRGVNGAGKSTLLSAMLRAARIPIERLLYLPQELDDPATLQLLGQLRDLPPEERGRVLSVVAALGVDPAALLASRRPSPGEARKLAMALGLGRHVWALVLDEPTNHLDLPSIERLEAAFAAYPGALVIVSHDDAFAERCTSSAWSVERGAVVVS
ncbi:MAG TPA: ATP-binding cassette domain-containing protein [Polyangiaceae bacterium]|nr:ATP-binding cassette domain-containing protein [Polyangiaceae bacterium]